MGAVDDIPFLHHRLNRGPLASVCPSFALIAIKAFPMWLQNAVEEIIQRIGRFEFAYFAYFALLEHFAYFAFLDIVKKMHILHILYVVHIFYIFVFFSCPGELNSHRSHCNAEISLTHNQWLGHLLSCPGQLRRSINLNSLFNDWCSIHLSWSCCRCRHLSFKIYLSVTLVTQGVFNMNKKILPQSNHYHFSPIRAQSLSRSSSSL